MHHNSSQGNADARHFNSVRRRSNVSLSRNTNQWNTLQINMIIQDIKQHYPSSTLTKDKINSWPTTTLVDLGSVTTIINTKLIEQVITNLLKENATLKDQLDTQSKHVNELKNMKREPKDYYRLNNDQSNRANETIEQQKLEIALYVSQVEELKEQISDLDKQ